MSTNSKWNSSTIQHPFPAKTDSKCLFVDILSNKDLRRLIARLSSDQGIPPGVRRRALVSVLVKYASGLSTGRPCGTVAILLMGRSGSGKSRTINKLVGANLLETGRYSSTTKEVQRVTIPAVQGDVELDLSFDDTPGLEDTTFLDREQNAVLFRKYCQTFVAGLREEDVAEFGKICEDLGHGHISNLAPTFRNRTYPNAVLVTASWNSIKYDAQNDANNFTSDVGKSLHNLYSSGLYDSERPNVVVVVTHAMLGYDTDCQDMSESEAQMQWKEDALVKESIIQEIAVKIFGAGNVVPVAFVENGASEKGLNRFRTLPNGEQSHRNLFFCLKSLFERNDGCGSDLQGLHSLGSVICGEIAYKTASTIAKSVFGDRFPEVQDNMSIMSSSTTLRPPSTSSDALDSLARMLLGTTINPVTGRLGGGRAVVATELHIRQAEDFRFSRLNLSGSPISLERQLNLPFIPRALHNFDYQGPQNIGGNVSTVYAIKEIAVATISSSSQISAEVLVLLLSLPPWKADDMKVTKQYQSFFRHYGTHFVRSAALGGFVAIALSYSYPPTLAELTNFLQTGQGTVPFDLDFAGLHCEGGDVEASAVESGLRILFNNSQQFRDQIWELRKSHWMEALRRDPVFLMNEVSTGFEWIYNAAGIPADTAHNLREASRWYVEDKKVTDFAILSGLKAYSSDSLPRAELRRSVESSIEDSINWMSGVMDRVMDQIVRGLVVAGTVAAVGAAIVLLA